MVALYFENNTAIKCDQPSTVESVKKKLQSLEEVVERYEESAEYLGGYRIEARFVCNSLLTLVNELTETAFTL